MSLILYDHPLASFCHKVLIALRRTRAVPRRHRALFRDTHSRVAGHFERLSFRPSCARALDEARPYFSMVPYADAMPARFR